MLGEYLVCLPIPNPPRGWDSVEEFLEHTGTFRKGQGVHLRAGDKL